VRTLPRPGRQYWLKEKPKSEVSLEVYDAAGTLVRKLSSKEDAGEIPRTIPMRSAARSGSRPHRGGGSEPREMDLMWAGATRIKRAKIDTGDPENGPLVVPGRIR